MGIDVSVVVFYGIEVECKDFDVMYESGRLGDRGEYEVHVGGSIMMGEERVFVIARSTSVRVYENHGDGVTTPIGVLNDETKNRYDTELPEIADAMKLKVLSAPQWWVSTAIS